MNRMEYLSKLKRCLSALPRSEREEAVKYYDELFSDAGPENEQAVISDLGSPQSLAHMIMNDKDNISYELNQTRKGVRNVKKNMSGKQTAAAIAVLVLTFPLWGGITIGLLGALLGIVTGAAAALAGIGIGGIVTFCMGVAYITKINSVALFLIGTGIALVSLVILIFMPVMNFVFWLIKLIIKGCIRLINKILGKTEARTR